MRINLTKKDIINSIYMQIGFSKKISDNLFDDIFECILENLMEHMHRFENTCHTDMRNAKTHQNH